MMRAVSVSTDVYAAIWAARQAGEDTEDAILRRVLNVPTPSTEPDLPVPKQGFVDPRFGVSVPEGFEIFRVYKGREFRAKAKDGLWWLPGRESGFTSLNQLSRQVTGKVENTWQNWYFTRDGKRVLIDALRNSIPRTEKTAEELGF